MYANDVEMSGGRGAEECSNGRHGGVVWVCADGRVGITVTAKQRRQQQQRRRRQCYSRVTRRCVSLRTAPVVARPNTNYTIRPAVYARYRRGVFTNFSFVFFFFHTNFHVIRPDGTTLNFSSLGVFFFFFFPIDYLDRSLMIARRAHVRLLGVDINGKINNILKTSRLHGARQLSSTTSFHAGTRWTETTAIAVVGII